MDNINTAWRFHTTIDGLESSKEVGWLVDRLFGRKEREEIFKSTDGRGQNSLNFRCGSSSFSDETTLSSTTHAFYHTTSTRSPARRTRRLFLLFRPRLLILSIYINQKRRASNPKKKNPYQRQAVECWPMRCDLHLYLHLHSLVVDRVRKT